MTELKTYAKVDLATKEVLEVTQALPAFIIGRNYSDEDLQDMNRFGEGNVGYFVIVNENFPPTFNWMVEKVEKRQVTFDATTLKAVRVFEIIELALDTAKINYRAEAQRLCVLKQDAGTTFRGHAIQTTQAEQRQVSSLISDAVMEVLELPLDYQYDDGAFESLDLDGLKSLGQTISAWRQAANTKLKNYNTQITAATKIADLRALTLVF